MLCGAGLAAASALVIGPGLSFFFAAASTLAVSRSGAGAFAAAAGFAAVAGLAAGALGAAGFSTCFFASGAAPPLLSARAIAIISATLGRPAPAAGIFFGGVAGALGAAGAAASPSEGGTSDDAIRADGAHYSNDGANRVAPLVADEVRKAAAARVAVATG